MKKIDIAIIGGGIGGLYSAYQLKKKYPERNIALFESLAILGGRIQTGSLADGLFQPGFGALRIEPDFQTEMHQFIQELNIPIKQIEQGEASSSVVPNLHRLSREEKQLILDNPDKSADVLLLELGLKKILGPQWDLDKFSDGNREQLIDEFKDNACYKGKPLYQQGIWNVFSDVLSYEAVEFFREKGAYYNMKNDNQNAADWIVLLLNLRVMKQSSYLPQDGMIAMIETIADKLVTCGVEIHMNHHLQALQQYDDGAVHLQFQLKQPTSSSIQALIAKHVILAIPQYPLQKLSPYFPAHINTLLKSVIPVHILWVAAVLKNPPWGEGAKPTSGENAPIRAAHLEYKEHKGTPYGMAMLYCDGAWRQYWQHFIEDEVEDYEGYQYLPQVNQNHILKQEIEKTIQQMFSMTDPPHIDEWGVRDWGRPPFGAGVHFWKAGAESKRIINQLKAFSLQEKINHKNIHICGEAYSAVQGYFEGAIRTANAVLTEIEGDFR